MLFDYIYIGNGMYKATGRCVKEELLSVVAEESEIEGLVKEKYKELCNQYYDFNFKRELVFKNGNVIELRNGGLYKIEGEYAKSIKGVKKGSNKSIYIYIFDSYCYYGCNAYLDVVKIYDSEMNLIAERNGVNPLSTKHFTIEYSDK